MENMYYICTIEHKQIYTMISQITIEHDSHENKSTYYVGKASVATLNFNSDEFECFEDCTEEEKDEMYSEMKKDREEFINQVA